jgi:ferredoxin
MEVDDALSSQDKKDNVILACQAVPLDAVEVDA